jgi:serine/threonine protein kinase
MLGKMLRHYRIDAKIGEGGMGVVYKAWDTHLDRKVAIKALPSEAVANPERKRRFVQEAKAASALNHPNIVTVYDIDSVEAVDFIAMEYIDGDTLDHRIGSRGMPLNMTLKCAIQISDALARAHAAGIVHRDLKPSNVMLDKHEQVKVLDFGLAKLAEKTGRGEFETTLTEQPKTNEGTIIGTISYMSPEQAEGKPVDARSDIFSFGSLLYEMVTGARAFQGKTKMSTLSAILSNNPPALTGKTPEIPHELERIVTRCLRKDPERRFQQMAEVKLALEDLKEEWESGSSIESVASIQRKQRYSVWWAAAVAVFILVGIGGWVWWRTSESRLSDSAQMTRITFDSGLTTDPALSADGKLLAYASDRATGENLDIWVQHLGGGDPVRLTNWDSDEMEPDFSPDGSRIVFHSSRSGGGIYVIPVLGGEPTLVTPRGFHPRYSPDGNWIAYWFGAEGGTLGVSLRQVFVVPANGGTARQIAGDLDFAFDPVWAPDGKRLIVSGGKLSSRSADWWIVPVESGPAIRTGMTAVLQRHKFGRESPVPAVWSPNGDSIVFSGRTGDSSNLYRVRISSDGKITQDPEKITFGTGLENKPALSTGGQLALASQTFTSHLWLLPADTNRGKTNGPMTSITSETTEDTWPRISPGGKRVIYYSSPRATRKFLLRNLEKGTQKQLLPAWNFVQASYGATFVAGGTRILFTANPSGEAGRGRRIPPGVYALDLNGGAPVLLRDKSVLLCASEEGSHFLVNTKGSIAVNAHTHEEFQFTEADILLSPQFSWDGRWVAMHVRNSETSRQIYVLPFHEGRLTPRSEWIPVTDGKHLDREPQWSPDGNLLYFLADRDGARGIYAQRLNPATKHPSGAPFEVKMFRNARRSMMLFANSGDSSPAVARDKIVFPLGEMTGNIWLTRMP